MSLRHNVFVVAAALVAVVAIAAVACKDTPTAVSVGGLAPASVGADGGAVALGPEAHVVVPDGALANPTTIDIARIPTPAAFAAARAIGQAYAFGPDGQTFNRDVTIAIFLPSQALGSADPDRLLLITTPAGGAAGVETVGSISVETQPNGYKVRGLTRHFSPFQVAVPNRPPTANAGADQEVTVGTTVELDGEGSDPDGDPLTVAWELLSTPAGSSAALQGTGTASPTFAPDVPGTYVARLTVDDGKGGTDEDDVTVTASAEPNLPPIADAGSDQQVLVGQTVILSGDGDDADGQLVELEWSFDSLPPGSAATIDDPASATTSFVADVEGTYVVLLTVTDDDGATDSDFVEVTAGTAPNAAPSADAGADQAVTVGDVVPLSGSGSDPDGDPLTFAWSFDSRPAGSAAAFADPTAAATSFVADVAGTFVARLTVSDGLGGQDSDTVAVTATAAPPPIVEIELRSTLTFSPSVVTIAPGTTVRWRNTTLMFHTVTPNGHSEFARATFNNAGDIFEHTFNTPGSFDYFCEPHLPFGMQGTINVVAPLESDGTR
jgi:plastocyanin